MSQVTPIRNPLPGERVLAIAPGTAAEAAADWLRRPNLFPGRALTAPTLEARQRWQAGRVAQRGQAVTAGTVRGLELSATQETVPPAGGAPQATRVRLAVEPGQGLAASGEDVLLARRLDCLLADVPVVAPPAWFEPAPSPGDGDGDGGGGDGGLPGEPAPRRIGARLADVLASAGGRMSRVGVLLLQPVLVDVAGIDAADPCDRCPCGDKDNAASFEDWRLADAVRLLWYPWPEDWRALPAVAPRHLRNALAHLVFDAEAGLPPDEVLPWQAWGVPVALLGLDPDAEAADAARVAPAFADRAAVVRRGGRAREPRLRRLPAAVAGQPGALGADARLPALWQARIEQFAEQLLDLGEPAPPPAELAAPFLRLPPFGLLPRSALDLDALRSGFFPPLLTLDAVPVPLEQLDAAVREAAPLAAIDLSAAGRVRLLVPVTQASWEPRLLLREAVAPEFRQTLDRFLLARARRLGARQGLRNEVALLGRALSGQPQAVAPFDDDAQAVERESLSPWGPPPAGGGHRSALRAGAHQHYFDSATETLVPAAGESLYVWAYLDADQPPRTLMLQWHLAGGDWEHRAYWGEDLLPLGAAGTAARRRMGDLPEAGRWLRLEVPAALVGVAGQAIDGMAFGLHDGQAAWGMAGALAAGAERKWFCNVLPAGARRIGDEAWDFLTNNDLWAPFEPSEGVVPAIADSVPAAPGATPGGHLEPSRAGTHQHFFDRATATFAPAPGELLHAWAYLDPNDPPREVMLQWNVGGSWEHRAYWGFDDIAWGAAGTPARFRAGGLPAPGGWVRLAVAPAQVGIAAGQQAIAGMAFTLSGGSAAFGAAGGLRPAGSPDAAGVPLPDDVERAWFAGALPAGAVAHGDWRFLAARDLHAPTASSAVGTVQALRDLLADPLLSVLSAQERAQLALRGLGPFVEYLRSRIDRADDLTDNGFVKMQTDVYRVRQLMLGSTDATRLAVSPALAQIAQAETAIASQAQIAGYLATVRAQAGGAVRSLVGAAGVAEAAGAAPAAFSAGRAALGVVDAGTFAANLGPRGGAEAFSAPAPAPEAGAVARPGIAIGVGVGSTIGVGGGVVGRPGAAVGRDGAGILGAGSGAAPAPAQASAAQAVAARATFEPIFTPHTFTPIDVVLSSPVVGKSSIRTTAIAQRLADPKSAEARNYALATRHESMLKLLRLASELTAEDGGMTPGLFEGFEVYGLRLDPFLFDEAPPPTLPDDDPRTLRRSRPLADFLAGGAPLGRLLQSPGRVSTDEAVLFSEAADLSDNTVALLRQLEGRIKRYRDALTRCEFALGDLQQAQVRAVGRLAAAADRLAEARHDVAVARALMAEETARIDAVNAHRRRVLAEEVRFVAFVRPRESASPVVDTPRRAVDPALAEAPVPACLRGHDDAPDELEAMLRVVREAPADWFRQVPALVERLDRPELLLRTLGSAQLRAGLVAARVAAVAQPAAAVASAAVATRLVGAVAQVLARQAAPVAARTAALAGVSVAQAATLTWKGLRTRVQEVVSFGDLIDGDHGRGEVARLAAAAFAAIGRICACLHAEFSGVLPSIRLDWAELLSQYDDPPNLRRLGNLPRWNEIDPTDRRQMQAYADWLYDQVDPLRPGAESLASDLIRMCLLLASHAPVGRIVAGRLPRPVPGVRPGTRIPLVALEPAAKLSVGMQAVLWRGEVLVARATVEDVGGGEVSARVVHTGAAQVDLGTDLRVQFEQAATVSATAARRAALGVPPGGTG